MKFIDKDIAEKIAKANGLTVKKLGLRFDKVVVRLLTNLRDSVSNDIPNGTTVLLTITAPIKLPSKTEFELTKQIRDCLNSKFRYKAKESRLFKNKIFIRVIDISGNQADKFIGFVHNPECNPERLLDLVVDWLEEN